ncbi:alkaline phosphatase [Alteromonas oceanisediminis]|uniref:alkaline phosphatase n=1 Tax=Alteromonas oceanisediminis TaxID=2836180 RepID=UPI001BDB4F37|nr:alkaline phosphatase [Alteromonas oceanisediminis]MBT0585702.1 alkaline phosphatase [Alteromonas oceanisediminis]
MDRLRLFTRIGVAATLSLIMAGCSHTAASPDKPTPIRVAPNNPKNIIMVVADGMGPAYVTAYRNFRDDPQTKRVETVIFDDMLVGTASTYPDQVSGYVTDSAASATALAAGVKSYNGAIGVDVNKQPVKTVLHQAKLNGKKTGLAVTSQIVHATPAAYVVANESRRNYNQIADSFFDDKLNGDFLVDVMLGGGQSYFERDDRNITGEFIDAGYQYVDTYDGLASLQQSARVLGLFAPVGLPWVLDDSRDNRLEHLTRHAIKHLENPEGFFLLVEASQVDWAGHGNDIGSAMAEMHDLAQTMTYLKEYVVAHPDTLVVLTADHSTGGLTIGAHGEYRWSPEWLHNMQSSISTIVKDMADSEDRVAVVEAGLGFSLNETERATINAIDLSIDVREQEKPIKALVDARTNTGWTTSGHTGVDVDVFAIGQGYEQFRGAQDNTDIAHKLFELLGTSVPNDTSNTPAISNR